MHKTLIAYEYRPVRLCTLTLAEQCRCIQNISPQNLDCYRRRSCVDCRFGINLQRVKDFHCQHYHNAIHVWLRLYPFTNGHQHQVQLSSKEPGYTKVQRHQHSVYITKRFRATCFQLLPTLHITYISIAFTVVLI